MVVIRNLRLPITGVSAPESPRVTPPSLTTEVNLALALKNYGVDVDFATIWGEGHTMAESAGDSVTNFIEWVNKCLK